MQETLPAVEIVVDRFHVAKHYRDCADKARKREMKRLKTELSASNYAQLKGVIQKIAKLWFYVGGET